MSRFPISGFIVAPLAALLLCGCSYFSGGESTSDATSAPARQLTVSDEPFAARSGAAILAQGGSAVDAATAMFFTLSVTYPVAAGPGGGGLCLVREPTGDVREFDFLPRAAAGGGAYAVPMAVRGFYDMQRRYGTLPWARMVAGAQAYADAGFPISEALAARMAGTESVIRLDASLAAEFLDESGQLKKAGTVVVNHDLAQSLSAIRESGADGISQGQTGARLIIYSAAQGGTLSASDLIRAATRQVAARQIRAGELNAAIPAPGTGTGAFAGALLTGTTNAQSVVAATRRALATFGVANLPADLGSTGFAAVDESGQAVACAVTLNGPFGSGRTATGTGLQLAAAPASPGGVASAFLLPVIAQNGDGVVLAAAGAGGPNGAAAAASVLLRLGGGETIGTPAQLHSTGAAPRDTLNAITCQSICAALSDPEGHGLGTTGDAP